MNTAVKVLKNSTRISNFKKDNVTKFQVQYIAHHASEVINDEDKNRVVFIFNQDATAIILCTITWKCKVINYSKMLKTNNEYKKFS